MTPTGTLLLLPLPKGIIQNVQRWSQPCCISIYALDLPSNFSIKLLCNLLSEKILLSLIGSLSDKLFKNGLDNLLVIPEPNREDLIMFTEFLKKREY